LEYAANATAYWTIDNLRQAAVDTARQNAISLNDGLERLLGSNDEGDIETYWKLVESNLRAGKVRLVFVADEIPAELRRLVEYLNERLLDVEVLAVEVKQFLGDGVIAVVPRTIGMTQKAIDVKSGERKSPLTLDEFLNKCTPEAADFFRKALDSALTREFSVYWGASSFSIRARVANDEREYASFLYGWVPNTLEVFLKQLPLDERESTSFRQDLLKSGIFKEAGRWTLRATVDGSTQQKCEDVYKFALDKVSKILKSNHQTANDS